MKSLRNNIVVAVILSLTWSSTAFANPLITLISSHMRETLALVNTFNKSVEDGDALLARIQDAAYGKNAAVYQELRVLPNGLNQRFKDNSATLVKLEVLRDSTCTQSFADASKSAESRNAYDACNELLDALGMASAVRGVADEVLDAINNAMSEYATVLAAEAARVAEAAAAKAAAAKAAAAKAAAAKAAALKKTTITCVKGKLTKKVTAVKPVCPAGYKKK
jgi:hypothetical protein